MTNFLGRRLDGKCPFEDWLDTLSDEDAVRIDARLTRIRSGNKGDWKPLVGTDGIKEFRFSFGPGYRIYFTEIDRKIILLLSASDKSDQKREVKKAKGYWNEYRSR